jgi:hypothetical protein
MLADLKHTFRKLRDRWIIATILSGVAAYIAIVLRIYGVV